MSWIEIILAWITIGALSSSYIAHAQAFQIARDHNKNKCANTTYLCTPPRVFEVLLYSIFGIFIFGFAAWVYFDLNKVAHND